jgi:hypothetical protein
MLRMSAQSLASLVVMIHHEVTAEALEALLDALMPRCVRQLQDGQQGSCFVGM